MNTNEDHMEWEKEAPKLASLSKTTPFSVPDKYFDDLQDRINSAIYVSELSAQAKTGFTVPSNYFDDLTESINAKLAVDQIKLQAPTAGFTTPDHYFNQLNAAILAKTVSENKDTKTKVFKLWSSDFMKYASAACVILVTAFGLYLNQQQKVAEIRNAEIANEQVLYGIDEDLIIEHLTESTSMSTQLASDDELESYILNNYSSNDISNNL